LRYWQFAYDSARKIRRQRIRHSRLRPLQAPVLLTCSTRELYLRKWLIRNQQASDLLKRMGKGANVVSYHDLATRPEAALRILMPRLGLDYQENQLRYGEAIHYGTVKREYQQATASSAIQLDVRWKQDLTADDIRTVSTDARVQTYLSSLDLELSDNGLRARGLH
jgi:hypothetical protein